MNTKRHNCQWSKHNGAEATHDTEPPPPTPGNSEQTLLHLLHLTVRADCLYNYFCVSDRGKKQRALPREENVPAGNERAPVPGQGADSGQHEPQCEAGRVRGPRPHSAASGADREGAERGKGE